MRNCILGAIILVAAAIVVGGMTDIVPAVTWEPLADFFRYASLLLRVRCLGCTCPGRRWPYTIRDAGAVTFALFFDAAPA